jgi:hypothetical protein
MVAKLLRTTYPDMFVGRQKARRLQAAGTFDDQPRAVV